MWNGQISDMAGIVIESEPHVWLRSMMTLEGGTKPDPPKVLKVIRSGSVNSAGSSRSVLISCCKHVCSMKALPYLNLPQ